MRGWFTGYALLLPLVFGNAFVQTMLAIPAALASHYSSRAGVIVWATTLVVLAGGVVVFAYEPGADRPVNWFFGTLSAIFVIGPQLVAFPLAGRSPKLFVVATFGVALTLAVLWLVLGVLSGATPD